ncbi:hypothetical protein CFO_g5613 [Ceratocystis platani]|uniref:Uncharacterized protein n=1 Tax=Ceratocystis fimbriata f. sp. platani TaxID=88771 RepID=A0A0F8AZ12_CERFI|nr:hypothetical protein CFO_g5613 [Ceratocystis platani]
METIETHCAREATQTARAVKAEFHETAVRMLENILMGKISTTQKKDNNGQGQPKEANKTPKDANVALSFAEVARMAAQTTASKQSPAAEPKSHETAKQGGEWQTVSRRKADKTAHPAPRQDDRILVRISAGNKLRDCESFLMTEKLKKLDAGLGKALKNVKKTKSGIALTAHKDGRATLLEKSDKIKKYLRPGTEVAQALNTDAYLIGPVVRHLNGGGKTVEVTEEMIRVCFAQATRIAPVYMTEKKAEGDAPVHPLLWMARREEVLQSTALQTLRL